jgi:hypothetical protein
MTIDVAMHTHPINRHSALIAKYGVIKWDDGSYEKEPSQRQSEGNARSATDRT